MKFAVIELNVYSDPEEGENPGTIEAVHGPFDEKTAQAICTKFKKDKKFATNYSIHPLIC